MDERTPAGIIAAVFVAPLVLLCCLGPAAVASLFAGTVAWLGGWSLAAMTGAAIAGGLFAYGVLRWRRAVLHRKRELDR